MDVVVPKHVLGPCYACFGHVMGMLKVCNMSLGMLCALWNIRNMEGYECKLCPSITQLFLENMNGATGRLGEKIAAVLLLLTAFTILG